MERQEHTDENGCIYEGQAQRLNWGDSNVKINIGLSRNQFNHSKSNEIDRCKELAEWGSIPESTRIRNAADGLTLLASDHWHSNRTAGHSNFNHEIFKNDNIFYANESQAQNLGIDIGDAVFNVEKRLKSGFKADDAPMSNWPTETSSKTIGGVWGFFWKNGSLAHSRYSNVCTIVSGEGVHSLVVRHAILCQMSQLTKCKKVVFWCWINLCWICIPHSFLCCFDWPFECAIGGFLGHTSNYPYHGICEFINGECAAIEFNTQKLSTIFEEDNIVFDFNFEDWQRERRNGIVLTTTKCIKYQQEMASTRYYHLLSQAQKQGKLHLFNNKKYRMTKRRQIAHDLQVYIVKDAYTEWEYNMSTDYFHAFDAYVLNMVKLVFFESHCCFKYYKNETKTVCKNMKIQFLNGKVDKYLSDNPTGSLSKNFDITSNGHGYKLICNSLNAAYKKMSWLENDKIESALPDDFVENIVTNNLLSYKVDMNLLVPTLKIAAQYVAHKHMRRGWSKIWISHVEKRLDGRLPKSVKLMKYHWRKGFNILLKFVPEAVCL